MSSFKSGLAAASLIAGPLVAGFPLGALAHAILVPAAAVPGQTWRGAVTIGHGCDNSPTIAVRLSLPAGAKDPKIVAKPGWSAAVQGQDIVWSGGNLPAHEQGAFPFSVTWPDGKPGEQVAVPVIQTCASAEAKWVEPPATGANAADLKHPAPQITFVKAADMPKTYTAGSLLIEQPWSRATPKGAPVAGGYLMVINTGKEPDRLVGASFALASKGEVHEMSMSNGVMHMKQVAGVEIPPGGAVELNPGGYHLMFMNLKQQITQGETVKGTLDFEKAGKVDVDFEVRAMNAGAGGHRH